MRSASGLRMARGAATGAGSVELLELELLELMFTPSRARMRATTVIALDLRLGELRTHGRPPPRQDASPAPDVVVRTRCRKSTTIGTPVTSRKARSHGVDASVPAPTQCTTPSR